jgi:stage II sporulation protein D
MRRLLSSVLLLLLATAASAQPSAEWIRVAVVREDPQVDLQIYGRFTLRALHTGESLQQGRRLPPVTVRAVSEGIALGEEIFPVVGVRIEPESSATISLNGKRLRGTVEIVRKADLKLLVVNQVALEDYLRGVLSKEAPDYWPLEALKAIAIAARTYGVYQRFLKETGDYDVTGDVMSQDYGGKTSEKAGTTRAVKATAGWILMYQDRLFPTFYHSTCGGMTEHARVMGRFDLAPLRGGRACSLCAASPFFSWQRRLTREDINWALHKSAHGTVGNVQEVRIANRTPSGRAEQIAIIGSRRTLRLSGSEFRALFGFETIRSTFFAVTPVPDGFVVEGHGWGHGVGLCQWGAAELARRGFSAPEILAFYYPGAELVHVRELTQRPIEIIRGGPP